MSRKLVTVQEVKALVPIEGADKIELAIINGWQVVVMKERHSVGELVLFYEIDSFLPAEDSRYASFEERFINWGDRRGMRLRTIRLRKQLSQGLVMPLADFPEVLDALAGVIHTDSGGIGLDVTELLKIEKWEAIEKERGPSVAGSSTGKKFPAFIRKTDQERIQNYGHMVQRSVAAGEEYEATMKKDGSSLTVFRVDPKSPYYKDARKLVATKQSLWARFVSFVVDLLERKEAVYGVCSRNNLLTLKGDSNFHKAMEKYDLLLTLDMLGGSFALQGEVVAPNIQDNYEKVSDVEFHLFDIYDIDSQNYLLPSQRAGLVNVTSVPQCTLLATGTLEDILGLKEGDDVVKKALEYAEGPGDNPGVKREGVVFKCLTRDFSFKAVSDSYLLKKG